MYFEKLSQIEQDKIRSYISYNVQEPSASLQHILRCWDEAKSGYLSTLFKENLIITEPISFEEGEAEICHKLYDNVYNDNRCLEFLHAIKNKYRQLYDPWDYSIEEEERNHYYFIADLINEYTLSKNAIEIGSKGYYDLPIGENTVRVQKGMKPMRVIAKIAQAYNIGTTPDVNGVSDLEYLRRRHSLCFNTKVLKGDLCLSIHPLDYMTMSDNNNGWESCMSWLNDGEYKQGTVEMMNSPSVVVAYLTGSNNFGWCDGHTWNSKKWRSLFIVDENFIINVKGYPYQNDNLVKEAIKKIASLAGWGDVEPQEYHLPDHHNEEGDFQYNGKTVSIDFTTGAMYNDFGSTSHFIAVNPNLSQDYINHDYCYSGRSECMVCGSTDSSCIGPYNDEGALICSECDDSVTCDWCEHSVYETYRTADGYDLCDYCYSEHTFTDPIDRKRYLDENGYEIYLANTNEELTKANFDMCESIYTYHHQNETCEPYFSKIRTIDGTYSHYLYVLPKDCTPRGLRLFGINNDDDLERYLTHP